MPGQIPDRPATEALIAEAPEPARIINTHWLEGARNDGEFEYTESGDCDGSHVAFFRRQPEKTIDSTSWEKIDAIPEGARYWDGREYMPSEVASPPEDRSVSVPTEPTEPEQGWRCPVHGIPDCSPLLNGCSLVIEHSARPLPAEPDKEK